MWGGRDVYVGLVGRCEGKGRMMSTRGRMRAWKFGAAVRVARMVGDGRVR